ncbi:hypothetical protein DV735_g1416, partial [Chaetothyriales sp. CBS 134920]
MSDYDDVESGYTHDVPVRDMLAQSIGFLGLPAYILSSFFPDALRTIRKHPKLVRALSIPLALYFILSYTSGKLLQLWAYLMTHFMSSVTISSSDIGLSAAFRRFLESKNLLLMERAMTAHSSTYIRNQASAHGIAYNNSIIKSGAVNYEPLNDLQAFRHDNRFFFITSRATVNRHLEGVGCSDFKVWTLGWSPEPIRSLIDTAYKAENLQRKLVKTCIYAPDRGSGWRLRCTRSRRPLTSVYLDKAEKKMIMEDIKDYLLPSTAKWYADRGIPYRRGYLFHGQPGTGKTSLAMALAGHFKLEVYVLSLVDPDVNDNTLQVLFQSLRPGVIVLLEDIDSAGIVRGTEDKLGPLPLDLDRFYSSDDGHAKKKTGDQQKDKKKQRKRRYFASERVTLSGLLNAIDGAGAPEGHILIMTSNRPESLDEALVRAGRVDVRVKFEYASKAQVREIFVNMYRPPRQVDEHGLQTDEYKSQLARIKALAKQFEEMVPARKLSPAQLQDYILMRKSQPEKAVEEVQQWIREQLELSGEVVMNGTKTEDEDGPAHLNGVGGDSKIDSSSDSVLSDSGFDTETDDQDGNRMGAHVMGDLTRRRVNPYDQPYGHNVVDDY